MRVTRLLALHGFTGSGDDFDVVQAAVARRGAAIDWLTPDLPGHGGNLPPFAGAYTVPAMAASVAAGLRGMEDQETLTVLLGYSMGGRVALQTALDWPESIDALVLIGAHPGIEDLEARAARAAEDRARAVRVRELGAAAFCAEWSCVPIIATQERVPAPFRAAMRARRAANDTQGLSLAAEVGGTGSMDPLWDRLNTLDLPTLLVVGEDDHKYRELVAEMLPRIPSAAPATISGAGHAAHLEAPDAFATRLVRFLDALG